MGRAPNGTQPVHPLVALRQPVVEQPPGRLRSSAVSDAREQEACGAARACLMMRMRRIVQAEPHLTLVELAPHVQQAAKVLCEFPA